MIIRVQIVFKSGRVMIGCSMLQPYFKSRTVRFSIFQAVFFYCLTQVFRPASKKRFFRFIMGKCVHVQWRTRWERWFANQRQAMILPILKGVRIVLKRYFLFFTQVCKPALPALTPLFVGLFVARKRYFLLSYAGRRPRAPSACALICGEVWGHTRAPTTPYFRMSLKARLASKAVD